ncbi:hypothetical protein HDV57DRAFT_234146 [Trichoderma longibrachiatum]
MVIMGLRSFLRFLMLPEPLDVGGRVSFLVRSASTSLPLIAADGVCCFRCKRRRRRRRREKERSKQKEKQRERANHRVGRRGEANVARRSGEEEESRDATRTRLSWVGIDNGWLMRKKCSSDTCGCCLSGCRILGRQVMRMNFVVAGTSSSWRGQRVTGQLWKMRRVTKGRKFPLLTDYILTAAVVVLALLFASIRLDLRLAS